MKKQDKNNRKGEKKQLRHRPQVLHHVGFVGRHALFPFPYLWDQLTNGRFWYSIHFGIVCRMKKGKNNFLSRQGTRKNSWRNALDDIANNVDISHAHAAQNKKSTMPAWVERPSPVNMGLMGGESICEFTDWITHYHVGSQSIDWVDWVDWVVLLLPSLALFHSSVLFNLFFCLRSAVFAPIPPIFLPLPFHSSVFSLH